MSDTGLTGLKGAIVLGLLLLAAFVVGMKVAPPGAAQILQQADGVELFDGGGGVPELAFVDEHGQATSTMELEGRWTLMFFGYTYCPDICPTTLMNLNRLWKTLTPEQQAQLQVVLVSVDPERDLPKSMSQYMDYFNRDFMAFTGNVDSMRQLAARLNAFYAKVEREDGGYLMDHSANIVLLDPALNYRGYIEPEHTAKRMRPLVQALLELD